MPDVYKMINATKEAACRQFEADQIRLKTGGTAPLNFDFDNGKGFGDEIAAISGGGSLPSVISKLDGGSFTLASDTGAKSYDIAHLLGVIPKGAMVWTEDNSESVAYTTFNFVQGLISSIPMTSGTTEYYGAYQMQARRADGTAINYQGNMTAAQLTLNDRRIAFPNNNPVYKAGCTYKWLAWV